MNKLSRVDYPIKELPSGDKLFISSFKLESGHAGPHVHIQASVHGAELQGNAVIFHLMQYFIHHPFKGSVTFIPLANPRQPIQNRRLYLRSLQSIAITGIDAMKTSRFVHKNKSEVSWKAGVNHTTTLRGTD